MNNCDCKKEIEINKGRNGTVFRVTKGSKIYALKKQKIPEDIALELNLKFKNKITISDTTNNYLREIYFNKFINKKSKKHFAVLYKYKIEESDFQHVLNDSYLNIKPDRKEKNDNNNKSKYTLTYLYDIKDGDLDSIFKILNRNQFISMLIQILYALYLMHINDFFHNDISLKNICYKKTELPYIKIFNFKIPTYGYIYSLIDFTSVTSINFKYDDSKLLSMYLTNNSLNDNISLIVFLLNNDNFVDFLNKSIKNRINDFKKYNNILLNKKIYDEDIEYFNKKIINFEEIKYYIRNIYNEKKLISYFYNKLNL